MENPIRNRIAENHIKNMLVNCEFDDCNAIMKYSDMQHHLDFVCQAMEIECKYKRLGCNWTGPRRNLTNHQHSGIDYDALVTKFEETDEEIITLKLDARISARFKDTIINHNIFGTFDFKSIWQDFHFENNFYKHQCISRYCGNVKHRWRLDAMFKIHVEEEVLNEPSIQVYCRILLCPRFTIGTNFQISIAYAQGHADLDIEGDHLVSRDDFLESDASGHDSGWMDIMTLEHDLFDANEIIKDATDAGKIKIFAWIK